MTTDELQMMSQRLDRLEQKLDEIFRLVTRQQAYCGPERSKFDGVCTVLYGNGRDGLITRVARLETTRRLWGTLIAALFGLMSGLIVAVTTWWLGR